VESPKCVVCLLISTVGGVFIEPWGSSTDLEKSVWHQVVAGQPNHMVGRSGGAASTDFLHRLGLLLLMLTRALEATSQTDIKHGRPALGPFRLGVWPTRSLCLGIVGLGK
jgi:hypothetical protein